MARAVEVPITPSVLAWAISESGYEARDLAERLGVDESQLGRWLRGQARPTLAVFHRLAELLHRPTATFLLPHPPVSDEPAIAFRHPPGTAARALLPNERLRIREVRRLQSALSWLLAELGDPPLDLVSLPAHGDPTLTAKRIRDQLGVTVKQQAGWKDVSAAFRAWRRTLEDLGIFVFLLPMGADAARGFSIWHETVPTIVVNTHWNVAARIYTLFHELVHLVTRTDSVCVESAQPSKSPRDLERWCEVVAAAVLLPEPDVRHFMESQKPGLNGARALASYFKVSLRAAALRLIDLELAKWAMLRSIPPGVDAKQPTSGGTARTRAEKRVDEYGRRAAGAFVRGLRRDVITPSDATRYLDVPDHELAEFDELVA